MKSLITTCVLVALMLGMIAANFLCLEGILSQTEEGLDVLPDFYDARCAAQVDDLNETWLSRAELLTLSVPFPTVDRISEQLATLSACVECGDLFGYRTALTLLYDAIDDMRRYRW